MSTWHVCRRLNGNSMNWQLARLSLACYLYLFHCYEEDCFNTNAAINGHVLDQGLIT